MSKGKNSRTYQDDFKKDAISLALQHLPQVLSHDIIANI